MACNCSAYKSETWEAMVVDTPENPEDGSGRGGVKAQRRSSCAKASQKVFRARYRCQEGRVNPCSFLYGKNKRCIKERLHLNALSCKLPDVLQPAYRSVVQVLLGWDTTFQYRVNKTNCQNGMTYPDIYSASGWNWYLLVLHPTSSCGGAG